MPGGRHRALQVRCSDNPNVILHSDEIVNMVGRPLTTVEEDWLDLLRAIHVADLICERGKNEDWNRHIVLSLALREPTHFASRVPLIRELFGRLTQDLLEVQLEKMDQVPKARHPLVHDTPEFDSVSLLSGGIDSAAAAAQLLERHSRPCFVSSRSASHVVSSQNSVLAGLRKVYGGVLEVAGFRVQIKRDVADAPLPDSDLSQRSRTLLFCGVAALIASARQVNEVTIGENGILAINCPLTSGRLGGFSTHTAHPDVLALMGQFFTSSLESSISIVNPLLSSTKTEVMRILQFSGLEDYVPLTHSCWIARTATHCGTCVPCLVRRFAAEAAGVKDATYETDVFRNLPSSNDPRFGNIGDYLMFANTLMTLTDDELLFEFDELNVEGGAPAQAAIVETHRRWASDVVHVAQQYPKLAALM